MTVMRGRNVIVRVANLGRKVWPFRQKPQKSLARCPMSKGQVDGDRGYDDDNRFLNTRLTESAIGRRQAAAGDVTNPALLERNPSQKHLARHHASSRPTTSVAVAKRDGELLSESSKGTEACPHAGVPGPETRNPAEFDRYAGKDISIFLMGFQETLETLLMPSWSLADAPTDVASIRTVQSQIPTDAAYKPQTQETVQALSDRLASVQVSCDLLNAHYLELRNRLGESRSSRHLEWMKSQVATTDSVLIKLPDHEDRRSPEDEMRKDPHSAAHRVPWIQPESGFAVRRGVQVNNQKNMTVKLREENKQLKDELNQAKTAMGKLAKEHEKLGRKYKAVDAKAIIFARQRDALSREVDRIQWQLEYNSVEQATTSAPAHRIELTPPPDQSWSHDPLPSSKRCREVAAQQVHGRHHQKVIAIPGWPAPQDITTFNRPQMNDVKHQIFDVRNLALDQKLRSGAQGTVAVVRSRIDNRKYVQKDQPLNLDNVYGGNFVPREKHFQEVLGRHPNIVELVYHRVYPPRTEVAYATTLMYFEYCEGGDLASLVQYLNNNNLHLAPVVVMQVMADIGAAIAHMHGFRETSNGSFWSEAAIVHRDVKPDNVFIHFPEASNESSPVDDDDDEGRPQFVLGDLGLATPESECQGLAGTPGFEQPELRSAWARINNLKETDSEYHSMLAQCVIGRHSDIWCFGATLFMLMTGCRPYTCSVVHMDHNIQAIRRGHETLRIVSYSSTLWQVVESLLEPNVVHRFPSFDLPQLVQAAREIVAGEWHAHYEQRWNSDCRLLSLGVSCLDWPDDWIRMRYAEPEHSGHKAW